MRSQLINTCKNATATVVRPAYNGCQRVSTLHLIVCLSTELLAPYWAALPVSRRTACMKLLRLLLSIRLTAASSFRFFSLNMINNSCHPRACTRATVLPKQIHTYSSYISPLALWLSTQFPIVDRFGKTPQAKWYNPNNPPVVQSSQFAIKLLTTLWKTHHKSQHQHEDSLHLIR